MLAHAERILRADSVFKAIAPGALAGVSRVANIKAGVLTLHAEHGAAASKLKQQIHFLAGEFNQRGVECNGIEVRVQPTNILQVSIQGREKPLSEQALDALSSVAADLPPASSLRAALNRLIDHAAQTPGKKPVTTEGSPCGMGRPKAGDDP